MNIWSYQDIAQAFQLKLTREIHPLKVSDAVDAIFMLSARP